jgi:NTP pyrophosphatase (non-canonical NTP hydrolase)
MTKMNEDLESRFFEMRALRNRARKKRAEKELSEAKKLYSQAIEVAKALKSKEDVEKLEKLVKIIELDILLERLHTLEHQLTQMAWAE